MPDNEQDSKFTKFLLNFNWEFLLDISLHFYSFAIDFKTSLT